MSKRFLYRLFELRYNGATLPKPNHIGLVDVIICNNSLRVWVEGVTKPVKVADGENFVMPVEFWLHHISITIIDQGLLIRGSEFCKNADGEVEVVQEWILVPSGTKEAEDDDPLDYYDHYQEFDLTVPEIPEPVSG